MLSPDKKMLRFGEIDLFESDLNLLGYTMSKVRFRLMENCFYVLVRYYLRIDKLKVRIIDTRIFH